VAIPPVCGPLIKKKKGEGSPLVGGTPHAMGGPFSPPAYSVQRMFLWGGHVKVDCFDSNVFSNLSYYGLCSGPKKPP